MGQLHMHVVRRGVERTPVAARRRAMAAAGMAHVAKE
jgi:hypothetical protein